MQLLNRFATLIRVSPLLICLTVGAGEAPKKYIGSIAGISGKVELREASGNPGVLLNPADDLYRPLYRGAELRCQAGGSVKVHLLFGQTLETNSEKWTPVREVTTFAKADRDRMAAYQGEHAVAAGRTRGSGDGPVRRALLVGINRYSAPPGAAQTLAMNQGSRGRDRGAWTDLDGCVSDVEGMYALLVTKFGFQQQNIVVLTNDLATRDNILSGLRTQLVEPAKPGDVSFFFYAGHGSQITNSASAESDKMDETIVPRDSWTGVSDIRDKEIRRCLNAALDKGALVTAIFDSCHSGSISRGRVAKHRSVAPDMRDLKDGSDFGPFPKDRGALVISAALSSQLAWESEKSTNGAFSRALAEVLSACPRDESVRNIFARTEALLRAEPQLQDPVLDANEQRASASLFGDQAGTGSTRTAIPVLKVHSEKEVELLGGTALGLYKGCELRPQGKSTNTPPRLRVTETSGPARALAEIVTGTPDDLKEGDLFEVDRWAMPDQPSLTVWIPPSLKRPELDSVLPVLRQIQASESWNWVSDPSTQEPTHFVEWTGKQWTLTPVKGRSVGIGPALTVAGLEKAFGRASANLFVCVPPCTELANDLEVGERSNNPSVAIARKPTGADYELVGFLEEDGLSYAWMRPHANKDLKWKVTLPVLTAPVPDSGRNSASKLSDAALRLGKIKTWLTMSGPEDNGLFPYRLALKRAKDGKLIKEGKVFDGERFGCVLVRDPRKPVGGESRYVYVFIIDSNGRSQSLYASPSMDAGLLPDPQGAPNPKEIPLGPKEFIKIGKPFSTDTYVMLTSKQPLPDPSVLSFDGVVRTRGHQRSADRGGLQGLLDQTARQTRGVTTATPTEWSIDRIYVESAQK